MAFKIWQIGLHLQQQEAVAVAIVRGAKECFLQRWWRLPLENDIIKDGRIVDAQQLAKTLLPWSRELPQRHHIMLAFPASRTLQRSFPRPSMSLGEREQTAWLSGTMARELDMDPDSLRFDYSTQLTIGNIARHFDRCAFCFVACLGRDHSVYLFKRLFDASRAVGAHHTLDLYCLFHNLFLLFSVTQIYKIKS